MSTTKIVISVVLSAAIAAGIYFYFKNYSPEKFSGWPTALESSFGIQFRHPADATISSPKSRVTEDGIKIEELIVTPAGIDPTRVHFFTTNAPLENAKNIKIYESAQTEKGEFEPAEIDGIAGVRRIDYFLNNDCTNEMTVAEYNEKVFGINLVACPTHPAGYDEILRAIADSVEFISSAK